MIQLYRLEFGKLVRRASCLAGVLLLFCIAVMFYGEGVDLFGSKLYLMEEDGTILHGRAAIRLEQKLADRYGGVLTDERVEQIVQITRLNERQKEVYSENYDKIDFPYIWHVAAAYFQILKAVTVEMDGTEHTMTGVTEMNDGIIPVRPIADVFPDSVLPLRLQYALPWSGMMESMIFVLFGLGLLMLLMTAPAFSEERMRRMNALLFTSRLGKRKCFWAKAAAAYSLGILLAAAVVLLHVMVTFLFFGGGGLSGSIQIADLSDTYQDLTCVKTVGECILDAALFYTADVIFAVSIGVLASVVASNLLSGIAFSAVIWAVPAVPAYLKVVPEAAGLIAPAVHLTGFHRILSQPDVTIRSVTVPYSYAASASLLLLSVLILLCAAWLYGHVTGE